MVCTGRESIIISVSLAKAMASKFSVWVVCPSSKSSIFFSLPVFTLSIKCLSHCTQISLVIQALSEHTICVPMMLLTRAHTVLDASIGGTNISAAFYQQKTAAFVPRCPLVLAPTCCLPFRANIFFRFLDRGKSGFVYIKHHSTI